MEDARVSRPMPLAVGFPVVPGAPARIERRKTGWNHDRVAKFRDGHAVVAIAGVLVAVVAGQGSDLLTFMGMMLVHGPAAEANPLVGHAVITFGLPAVIAIKIALIVFVVATFAIVARDHRRTAAFVATVGTVVGLIGAYSNILAMS